MKSKFKYISLKNNNYKLNIRKDRRAKRIILKISSTSQDISITIPKYETERKGLEFLYKNKKWVLKELDSLPKKIPFKNFSIIPYMGVPHKILHVSENTNLIYAYKDKIIVFSKKEDLSMNIKNWLFDKAKSKILNLANLKVKTIGKQYNKINIKELKTSWGTCGENGNLSFSWRLILAPSHVMEYIVVHELCHLVELNHSKEFWQLVTAIFPQRKYSQNWLKLNGTYLHLIG